MTTLAETPPVPTASARVWGGRVLSGLVALFFVWDAAMKVAAIQPVMEATTKLGFAPGVVQPLGLVLLAITVLYAIPRTATLGAVLLTAYLGGATATMVHVGQPFYFPVAFGVLVWAGLALRRPAILSTLGVTR